MLIEHKAAWGQRHQQILTVCADRDRNSGWKAALWAQYY